MTAITIFNFLWFTVWCAWSVQNSHRIWDSSSSNSTYTNSSHIVLTVSRNKLRDKAADIYLVSRGLKFHRPSLLLSITAWMDFFRPTLKQRGRKMAFSVGLDFGHYASLGVRIWVIQWVWILWPAIFAIRWTFLNLVRSSVSTLYMDVMFVDDFLAVLERLILCRSKVKS